MPTPDAGSLSLLRRAFAKYTDCDVVPEDIVPEAHLDDLNVDSLSLAEMLFALEDALGESIIDVKQRPETVADLMALIEPHMQVLTVKMPQD